MAEIRTTILDPMFNRAVASFSPELDGEGKVAKTDKEVALEDLRLVIHSWAKAKAGGEIDRLKAASNIDAEIGALEKERRTLVASSITVAEV